MVKPHGHKTQAVTGLVTLVNANGVPPRAIMAHAVGGTASLLFVNTATGATLPKTGLGDSAGAAGLVAGVPVEFDLEGENVNAVTVTLGTATSVELVWQI